MLGTQLEEEKRKCEDLQFRFEEESIDKDDIQVYRIFKNKFLVFFFFLNTAPYRFLFIGKRFFNL